MGNGRPAKWQELDFTPVSYWELPRTRHMALRKGVTHWFDGVMCKRGHVAPSFASSGACVLCAQEGQRRRNSA